MNGLLFLIPLALAMGFAGLVVFLWALKSGQYDDLDGAAGRILYDDPAPEPRKDSPSRPPARSSPP
jgi:cbb3-type cytochrome oxidase maturation protein